MGKDAIQNDSLQVIATFLNFAGKEFGFFELGLIKSRDQTKPSFRRNQHTLHFDGSAQELPLPLLDIHKEIAQLTNKLRARQHF
ncbi:hypothetical protein D3C86_1908450 [compost metagenome]